MLNSLMLRMINPQNEDHGKRKLLGDVQEIMRVDGTESARPLSHGGSNFDVPYKKGAAMIRMMEHFLTKETLTNGLRNYLKAMYVLSQKSVKVIKSN